MKKILISVEGPTEEQFIESILRPYLESILQPYLLSDQCFLQPVILKTRREPSGKTYKGGVSSYDHIKKEVKFLLGDTSACIVTTMYDYYGLPNDFPGKKSLQPQWDAYQKVQHLEEKFQEDKDINDPRFIAYLSLHEFEALLLSDIDQVIGYLKRKGARDLGSLSRIKNILPELVDDNNPPSHRIRGAYRGYGKLSDGILLAEQIGLHTMLEKCPHFKQWVDRLRQRCTAP
jgi:hypothetical protein